VVKIGEALRDASYSSYPLRDWKFICSSNYDCVLNEDIVCELNFVLLPFSSGRYLCQMNPSHKEKSPTQFWNSG